MKVKLFLRSGDSVLTQFSFLETHLPMAGNAVHACCSFCWSEESSVATSEQKHVKKHVFVCAGHIISSRSNAVLMGIAGKSNEMWQEVVSLCDNLEPEVPIVQEPEQTTCALRNVQISSGEKAAAVTNAEGVHTHIKKHCRTPFFPTVLVGGTLEKAMAGYQTAGRPSAVDGSAQC